jgi:hypothetical protein
MTEFVGLCFLLLWETVRKSTIRRNTQVSDHDLSVGLSEEEEKRQYGYRNVQKSACGLRADLIF